MTTVPALVHKLKAVLNEVTENMSQFDAEIVIKRALNELCEEYDIWDAGEYSDEYDEENEEDDCWDDDEDLMC